MAAASASKATCEVFFLFVCFFLVCLLFFLFLFFFFFFVCLFFFFVCFFVLFFFSFVVFVCLFSVLLYPMFLSLIRLRGPRSGCGLRCPDMRSDPLSRVAIPLVSIWLKINQ